jgi:signal-transduction protein with cAMP-binding, CBS, and nucleotidyltransferase domain
MTIAEKLFALKSTPPFDRLRDSELALIAEVARYRRYASGEIICSPSRPLRRLHLVVNGGIRSTQGATAPRVFGVAAVLFDRAVPDSWRAVAPEGADCLLIQKGNFFTMIHECTSLAAGFLDESRTEELAGV